MKRKPTEEMTDEQFERWLKRNRITGMAAFSATTVRRRKIEQSKKATP